MQAPSLDEIRRRVVKCAAVIGAPAELLPTYGSSDDFARPHIEVHGHVAYYVVMERGEETLREPFLDLDGLLCRIFESVTFSMASQFELTHRRSNEDFRRQLFAKQLEYLAALSPNWVLHLRSDINATLSRHPFSDALEPSDHV